VPLGKSINHVAANHRTRHEREFDLGRTSRWYREGMAPSEIARKLGLSKQQVNYDLREIRRRWLDAQIFNFNEAKAIELARLDGMILRAEGFLRRKGSLSPIVRKQWASVLVKCIDQRCKILGLYGPPVQISPPAPVDDYRDIVQELTHDECVALHRVLTRTAITVQPVDVRGNPGGVQDAGLVQDGRDHQTIEEPCGHFRSGIEPGNRDAIDGTETAAAACL
jgi:hypothetical protein